MTYEEALEKITNLAVTYSQIDTDTCELFTIAKKALEKQISKKPMITILTNVRAFKCPSCGGYRVHSYCDDCGQKLDWSEKLK